MIRAAKFWTNSSFLMLRLLVLDPRRRAIIEFAENKGTLIGVKHVPSVHSHVIIKLKFEISVNLLQSPLYKKPLQSPLQKQ